MTASGEIPFDRPPSWLPDEPAYRGPPRDLPSVARSPEANVTLWPVAALIPAPRLATCARTCATFETDGVRVGKL